MHWRPRCVHARTHIAYGHGIDLDLRELLTSCSAHIGAVCHELCLVLLEFGILHETLVLANAALLEATENEDSETNSSDTTDACNDGNLSSAGQTIPTLRGRLHS